LCTHRLPLSSKKFEIACVIEGHGTREVDRFASSGNNSSVNYCEVI
jgi:hypothetical protein